jgi:hypothetical protein
MFAVRPVGTAFGDGASSDRPLEVQLPTRSFRDHTDFCLQKGLIDLISTNQFCL